MQITLHYSTKIGTIKQAFSKNFPYLKIEFIKKPCTEGEANSWSRMVLHNMFVGEINNALKRGSINISGDRKIVAVKQLFEQNFGLPVQIFRKEKKAWIPTTRTEELTLSQQNEQAKKTCAQTVCATIANSYLEDVILS